jgi:hypothetical protein
MCCGNIWENISCIECFNYTHQRTFQALPTRLEGGRLSGKLHNKFPKQKIRERFARTKPVPESRAIRDPIHRFITLNEKEAELIDSEAFQRLRHLRQLAFAYLVYPSATHTRFEHSLGVCHVAGLLAS